MLHILLTIFSAILVCVGFVFCLRLGARVSEKLYRRSKWAPIFAALAIFIGGIAVMLVLPHPSSIFTAIGLWVYGFGGRIIARAQQIHRGR
jgi:hypothetical protein